MQLFINDSSPYSRVVRVAVLEKGLHDDIQLFWADPWAHNSPTIEFNPASRLPVLVTPEGIGISESLLIVQYLDSMSAQQPLMPKENLAHALHFAGLGQGLMEAAFTSVITKKFERNVSADSFLALRRDNVIKRTLSALDGEVGSREKDRFTIGEIIVWVALAYIEFRLPDINWKEKCPSLHEFFERFSARDSFTSTPFK
ncbi:glutathione S-transferase family protein [Pseudomonas sp. GM80]|uniref:glutathione S-transferase family protein n=1 Tax=Pseudomonas sp. GM80 TaxID=1144339 RepID=UPI00026FC832|nr:glutathione S-transferase N-terminal domain-containing protein [Pseudomonas sp. GM80]EJN34332.1 glutathione S-transferase [Pseudomonas sp. GM80]